eukprot:7966483-Pyramimonas_sp.AAC.1
MPMVIAATAVLWRCCRSCAITPPFRIPGPYLIFPLAPARPLEAGREGVQTAPCGAHSAKRLYLATHALQLTPPSCRALPSSLTLAPIIAPPRNQSNSLAKAQDICDGRRNA